MNWLDRAVLAGGFENAFHRHLQRSAPANPPTPLLRLCFIADISRCRNIRPKSNIRGTAIIDKNGCLVAEAADKIHMPARVSVLFFSFYYFSQSARNVARLRRSRGSPLRRAFQEHDDEMNRRISDEREHPCENSREHSERNWKPEKTPVPSECVK